MVQYGMIRCEAVRRSMVLCGRYGTVRCGEVWGCAVRCEVLRSVVLRVKWLFFNKREFK